MNDVRIILCLSLLLLQLKFTAKLCIFRLAIAMLFSFDHEGYMIFEQSDVPTYLAMMQIPTKVSVAEGDCDCCGWYTVTDIKLPSGKELYNEDHFGNCNFPCDWDEFFELVEIERTYLRKG